MFRLLIVDDEDIIVEGLQLLIPWQDLGVEIVATANSGEAALQIIKKQKIDILLTDISMDQVSGLDLIERLAQQQPAAKSIVMSGFDEFDYIKKGLQLGIENYLLKPVNANELLQTIQAVIEKLRCDLEESTEKEVMKEHITKRIFFNQIERNEFIQRANLLKLDLPGKSCRACILSWSDTCSIEERKTVYYQFSQIFSRHGITYLTQLEINRLGFLLNEAPIADLKETMHQLETDLAKIDFITSFNFYIGAANPLAQQFHLSIESAETMYEYFRLLSNNFSFFYDDFSDYQNEEIKLSEQDFFKKLDSAIDLRDQTAIKIQIQNIFANVTQCTTSSAYLGNIAYVILLKLFQGFHKVYLNEFQTYAIKLKQVTRLDDIIQILLALVEHIFSTTKFSNYSEVIRELLNMIDQNYSQPLSLKSVSKSLYVNTAYLGQLFQKEVGISFSEYLNNYRMQVAKHKLTQTTDSVETIALSIGFNDASYFSRKFKQCFHQSPNSYRAGN